MLVTLGAGAALSSLISAVPGLVWISEYKSQVFAFAGIMLLVSGALQRRMRFAPCPLDPALRTACLRTRKTSARLFGLSVLRDKPAVLGLAVPGMPVGSPGMDGAVYGDRRDPYDVLLVSRDGSTRIFQSYNRKANSA
jgi:hypothetical protein